MLKHWRLILCIVALYVVPPPLLPPPPEPEEEAAAAAPILTRRELRELGCDIERALERRELPDPCPPGSLRWR